ncbi:Transposable element tcb2 transposase [Caligus rogercresseyi]|uniref:Transposable element tcb2 transposase n=1 Tax=Caligus rogercresseyi TaxID=217165 RepID=A0A7T8HH51_CALRO|nr:Transposable element tcb2 transposase [Caligus rogercresseyi]
MLGVSRTFIWSNKKVFQETGKITRRPEQGMVISEDTKADQDRRRQDTTVVNADLDMKPFKYRKIHILNEATRVKRKARSKLVLKWYADNPNTKEYQKRLLNTEAGIRDGLRAVVSNGKKSSLLRIPDRITINKIVYLDVLETIVFSLIQEKFGGVPICFQQDGAPTDIAKIVQEWSVANFYHFWSKDLGLPHLLIATPLTLPYRGWA